jgi:hypothetical protein
LIARNGGGSGGSWHTGNWNHWRARIVRCESRNDRHARCNVHTRGGVRMAPAITVSDIEDVTAQVRRCGSAAAHGW